MDDRLAGPPGSVFPTTRWSLIHGTESGPDALAHRYWRPIHAYLRRRFGRSIEDALDLTQDFFAWMIESDFLAKADPGRGRFRSLLKVALKHYVLDKDRRENAAKRGGQTDRVTFEAKAFETIEIPDLSTKAPEDILDEAWKADLVERALDHLSRDLESKGKGIMFSVFHDYFVNPTPGLEYAELAKRYGITPVDVSNWLARTKKHYRAQLRKLVLETVSTPQELEAEMAWLLD